MSRIIKGAAVEDTPHLIEHRQRFTPPTVDTDQQAVPTAQEQAAALLEQAQQQAAAIMNDAQQQAEHLLQTAHLEGEALKEEAQHQGYNEGMQMAESEAVEIRRQAQQVLQQAEQVRQQTYDDMEQEIIALAVEMAEKLLATQLRLDENIVVETAKEALKLVRDREQVTLYVHPQEADIYLGSKQQLEQALSDRAKLSIIMDEQVQPGGCMVQTEQGMVDATVDTRWQQVLKAVNVNGG